MMASTPSGSNPSPSPLISPFTPSAQSLTQTPPGHLSTLVSYVQLIGEPLSLGNLEKRLKAAQEIAEHLQTTIASHPKLNDFINDMLTVFMRVLRDTEPHFISEHPLHQLRKQILEIILRLPTNDVIKEHYVSTLLTQMFRLFEIENEENALVCMKIIMDLHRYYRPSINAGIHNFLVAVKQLYSHLASYMPKIFEQQSPLIVKDLRKMSNIDQMCQRINVEQLLQSTFTQLTITDTRPEDKSQPALNYVLLPRSTMSLKVLAEVPLMVVLWYQLYGKLFHMEIADFTVTTINCLLLQPPIPSTKPASLPQFPATPGQPSTPGAPASSGGGDGFFVKEVFKEIYVDFITVQIKVASFIAFVAAKVYKDLVVIIDTQGQALATGLLQLLMSCPPEAYHLRRELLIAVRHILNSELMTKFIPHVEKLFDEKLLLSNGYSVQDSLQPLAYTTLADLVHRIRNHLSFETLSIAVNFYARHVHAESFQWGIQQICCRLMMNLVDCIRKRTEEDPQNNNGRDLLLRILEMYCLKFRTLAKHHIPMLMAKCTQPPSQEFKSVAQPGQKEQLIEEMLSPAVFVAAVTDFAKQEQLLAQPQAEQPQPSCQPQQHQLLSPSRRAQSSFATHQPGGYQPAGTGSLSQSTSCPLVECRHLVKTLVGATKQVTWGLQQCIPSNRDASITQEKLCQPREVQVYVRLVKHATAVLDIYLIVSSGRPGALTYSKISPSSISPQLKNKEEKEVLEHFAGIFNIMNPETFRQIFVQCIDTLIERFIGNPLLQVIINSFLANQLQSSTFATILLQYLLVRLPLLGSTDPIRPPIYLKLFRSIFGSISLYPLINEAVLEPHLVSLVSRCVQLSKSAAHPSNYLMLLRCLFRAIGGGTTERLYKEFYQLLPSLLKTLSRLNYDCHRAEIHDLFVELCLTVPVRLSTLLPFLHLLMGPLVSALSGSASLVQQGLRTLELCVDNVQPDYFYNYIQPVHRDLMSALCCCLNGPPDVALTALRIFGKLGGTGRDRLAENHILTPSVSENGNNFTSLTIRLEFPHQRMIELKLDDAVRFASKTLHQAAVQEHFGSSSSVFSDGGIMAGGPTAKDLKSAILAKQAFEFAQMVAVTVFNSGGGSANVQEIRTALFGGQMKTKRPFTIGELNKLLLADSHGRCSLRQLLESIFYAMLVPEIRRSAADLTAFLVDRLCLVMLAQEAGIFPVASSTLASLFPYHNYQYQIDGWIIFDAVLSLLANERKDVATLTLQIVNRTYSTLMLLLGGEEQSPQFWSLISVQYFAEKVVQMCFSRPWFVKAGGCRALTSLIQLAAASPTSSCGFMTKNAVLFADALFYILNDIDQEVSFCCHDLTVEALDKLFDLLQLKRDVLDRILEKKVIPSLFSSCEHVRTTGVRLLEKTAGSKPVSLLLKQFEEPLRNCTSTIRERRLKLLPYATQVGLLNGCLYLAKSLPTFFASGDDGFINTLIALCDEPEREILAQQPCYKNVTALTSLKCVALQLLTTYVNNQTLVERIFAVICKALLDVNNFSSSSTGGGSGSATPIPPTTSQQPSSVSAEVTNVAFEAARTLIQLDQASRRSLSLTTIFDSVVKPFLTQQLAESSALSVDIVRRCHYLIQLFPNLVGEQALDELLASHLEFWLERAAATHKNSQNIAGHLFSAELRLAIVILETFQYFPVEILTTSLLSRLISSVVAKETAMLMQNGSPLCEPLLACLRCYPTVAVSLLLSDRYVNDVHTAEMFIHMLKNKEKAVELRQELLTNQHHREQLYQMLNFQRSASLTYVALRSFCTLLHYAPVELASDQRLAEALLQMWTDPEFVTRFTNIYSAQNNDFSYWRIPSFVSKLLVHRASSMEVGKEGVDLTTSVDLVFQLLSAFDGRYVYQFQNVRKFVDETAVKAYPVSWVRAAFFRFATIFTQEDYSQEFKSRIVVNVLIPAIANAFESGMTDALIGSKPQPDSDSDDNIISVFLNTIIDPEALKNLSDSMMVALLQLACLLVDCAPCHIHDSVSKKQGTKLRRLMTFAWPSLLPRNCIDPSVKYYGHLLLAHIIAKFAIHKKIVLQVLNSLLKAHTSDSNVKAIVHSALHTLMPALPARIASDDATTLLGHLTKRILLDDGQQPIACAHVLALVIRHQKLYYPVRFQILELCCQGMNRILNQSSSLTADNKKLIIDLCEVIIRWEQQRVTEEAANQPMVTVGGPSETTPTPPSQQPTQQITAASSSVGDSSTLPPEIRRSRHISGASSSVTKRPMERTQCDTIVNSLIRVASFLDASSSSSSTSQPSAPTLQQSAQVSQLDPSGKRALCLLKSVLCPEMWPTPEIQLQWMDRILLQSESASTAQQQAQQAQQQAGQTMQQQQQAQQQAQTTQANTLSTICASLEALSFLISIMNNKEQVLNCVKQLQMGLAVCVRCTNLRVTKLVHLVLNRVMAFWPPYDLPSPMVNIAGGVGVIGGSMMPSQYAPRDELEPLYAACAKVIHDGLVKLEKAQPLTLLQLTPTLFLVRTARLHSQTYVDKILSGLVHVLLRLTKEHTQSDSPGQGGSDLILIGLELLKGRTSAMSVDTQKEFVAGILGVLIEKSQDPKVIRMIIRIVDEWMNVRAASSSAAASSSSASALAAMAASGVPSPRERTALLCKLMNNVERRFANDDEVCTAFYSLVIQVYRDDSYRGIEMASKLEPAFLCGLKSRNPELRAKFFEVLDSNVPRSIIERLLYITSSQNWENIGQHFWVKQCVELLLSVADRAQLIGTNLNGPTLPTLVPPVPPAPPPSTAIVQQGCVAVIPYPTTTTPTVALPTTTTTVATATTTTTTCTAIPPPIPSLAVKSEPTQSTSVSGMEVDHPDEQLSTLMQADEVKPSIELVESGEFSFPKAHTSLTAFFAAQSRVEPMLPSDVGRLLASLCHLVHSDVGLASSVWVDLFVKIWRVLSRKQQTGITSELVPFLCSGAHLIQRDLQTSALKPIFEACLLANPPLALRPFCVKYIGKTHRAWYEAVLVLERYLAICEASIEGASAGGASGGRKSKQQQVLQQQLEIAGATGGDVLSSATSLLPTQPAVTAASALSSISLHETVHCLSELYDSLGEIDLRCSLWQRKSTLPESATALGFYQYGLFDQARVSFEQAMRKEVEKHAQMPMNAHEVVECQLMEDLWIDCCRQLSHWQVLKDFSSSESEANSLLMADVVWRLPDWALMREHLSRIDINTCPTEWQWKASLYQGFTCLSLAGTQGTIANIDDIVAAASNASCGSVGAITPAYASPSVVQRCVEAAFQFLMRDWRRSPPAVTPAHVLLLQAAQQVIELSEAPLIVQAFSHGQGTREQQHTVKTILKTWKNRLPLMTESLEHWSNIISWRQHNYRLISNEFSTNQPGALAGASGNQPSQQTIVQDVSMYVGVHESCHTLIQFGRIARKHGIYSVCFEVLDRIYTIPTIPVVDVFRRIRQQLKCYLQLGLASGNRHDFQEGLDILDACKMQYFNKEMTAPLLAQRGSFLTHINKVDEAQRSFSAAFQLDDPPSMAGAWGQWGELLEQLFMRDRSQLYLAVNALCCFTHACRTLKPGKGRKFLARVFWLLTFDDQRASNSLTETFAKRYAALIPSAQFAHWIPQFVTCLLRQPSGRFLVKTAMGIAQILPQQMYYILRQAYLAMKEKPLSEENILPEISEPVSNQSVKTEPEDTPSFNAPPVPTMEIEGIEGKIDFKVDPAGNEPLSRLGQILRSIFDAYPTFVSAAELLLSNLQSIAPPKPSQLAAKIGQLAVECYRLLAQQKGLDSSPLPQKIATELATIVAMAPSELPQLLLDLFKSDFQSQPEMSLHQTAILLMKWQRLLDQEKRLRELDSCSFESLFVSSQSDSQKNRLVPNALLLNSDLLAELEVPGEAAPGALITTDSSDGGVTSAAAAPTGSSAIAGGLGIGGPFSRDRSHLHIVKILPQCDLIYRFGQLLRRVHILAANGKIFSYLLIPSSGNGDLRGRCEDAVLQLGRSLNPQLLRCRETARRGARFSAVRTLSASPTWRAVEDAPQWCSLSDIWRLSCRQRGVDPDAPLMRYFERLTAACKVATTGGSSYHPTQAAMRDLLKDVQAMVPRSFLRDWAVSLFADQTQYFLFRKRFTTSLSIASMAEYIFYLTPMTPEVLMIDPQTGVVSICFHQFDIDESTANLDANRPVPFRLTPVLADFMGSLGISGPFTAIATALSRSLAQPPTSRIGAPLRILLKDVFVAQFSQPQFGTAAQKVPFSNGGSDQQQDEAKEASTTRFCDEISENVINATNKATANITTRLLGLVSSFHSEQQSQSAVTATGGSNDASLSGTTTTGTSSSAAASSSSGAAISSTSTSTNIQKLVIAAQSLENLCRVDPTLLPWL